jgi:hypothetical protein
METWVIGAALVVLCVIVVAFIRSSSRESVETTTAPPEFEDGVVSEPVPMPRRSTLADEPAYVPTSSVVGATARLAGESSDASATAEPRRMRWSRQFDPAGGTLTDEARLKLIADLGLIRADWSNAILEQALIEETGSLHLAAVRESLGKSQQ